MGSCKAVVAVAVDNSPAAVVEKVAGPHKVDFDSQAVVLNCMAGLDIEKEVGCHIEGIGDQDRILVGVLVDDNFAVVVAVAADCSYVETVGHCKDNQVVVAFQAAVVQASLGVCMVQVGLLEAAHCSLKLGEVEVLPAEVCLELADSLELQEQVVVLDLVHCLAHLEVAKNQRHPNEIHELIIIVSEITGSKFCMF